MISAINKMHESIRYAPTMVRWVVFHATKVNLIHSERPEGKTTSLKKQTHPQYLLAISWRSLIPLAPSQTLVIGVVDMVLLCVAMKMTEQKKLFCNL